MNKPTLANGTSYHYLLAEEVIYKYINITTGGSEPPRVTYGSSNTETRQELHGRRWSDGRKREGHASLHRCSSLHAVLRAGGARGRATRRELSSPPTKCKTSTDRSISLRGTWLSSFSICTTATSFSSGPASAWIACADKVHRVNSQVTAGLRRPVRTHAACISTLIALRPSLGSVRCCDHTRARSRSSPSAGV